MTYRHLFFFFFFKQEEAFEFSACLGGSEVCLGACHRHAATFLRGGAVCACWACGYVFCETAKSGILLF